MSEIISTTVSLCPVCLKQIPARYIERDDNVYMEKDCPSHGSFSVLCWEGNGFLDWQSRIPAENHNENCPFQCGICQNHKQSTCCVLLEVTGGCDLLCPICFAQSEAEKTEPSLEEIAYRYDYMMNHGGPFNIQLSGGEPTLRDDLPEIIKIGRSKGFAFFQLNTNGLRIASDPMYLESLKSAGLNTVFLQFDSLNTETTIKIRGKDIVAQKLRAVENCANLGIGVVLVPTVVKGVNSNELWGILKYAAQNMPTVRGVHFQPLSFFGRYNISPSDENRLTLPGLMDIIKTWSGGRLKKTDFLPGNAEHPLCSFHRDYILERGKWIPKETAAGCCGVSSEQARQAVAKKWSYPKDYKPEGKLDALDIFLQQEREKDKNVLAISAMAFQDVWNIDLNRLKYCYIHVVGEKGLVPFCAYNLTDSRGNGLYRSRGKETF